MPPNEVKKSGDVMIKEVMDSVQDLKRSTGGDTQKSLKFYWRVQTREGDVPTIRIF